jgi:hypothetical protein
MFIQLHDIKGGAFWIPVTSIRWMERLRKRPQPNAEEVDCTELLLWAPRPGNTEVGLKTWVSETPEFINQQSRIR